MKIGLRQNITACTKKKKKNYLSYLSICLFSEVTGQFLAYNQLTINLFLEGIRLWQI